MNVQPVIIAPQPRHAARSCPADFDQTYVEHGRMFCEDHYRVGRITVARWIEERGRQRLLRARAERVRERGLVYSRRRQRPTDFAIAFVKLGPKGCERRYGAHHNTVKRWVEECGGEVLLAKRARYLGRTYPDARNSG